MRTLEYYENFGCFDVKQLKELEKGIASGVDVDVYARSYFSAQQMAQIRMGLESGVNAKLYAKSYFSHLQMQQLRKVLTEGLDAHFNKIAKPCYSHTQMYQLTEAVKEGVETSQFERSNISAAAMAHLITAKKNNMDTRFVNATIYTVEQVDILAKGAAMGFDVRGLVCLGIPAKDISYALPLQKDGYQAFDFLLAGYNKEQLAVQIEALKANIALWEYTTGDMPAWQCELLLQGMKAHLDVTPLVDTTLSKTQAKQIFEQLKFK